MSEEEKNKNNMKDMLGDAKDGVRKAAEKAEESAKEFANEAKETFNNASGENKKILVGVLAIVLGSLGVHKFILGYNKEGIILLVITIVVGFFTCGLGAGITGIVGLIEGIVYLTKTDEEFYNTYQANKKPWF